ncbi:hypothetical protein SAMN05216525_10529 [Bradyrhizobium sp. Gha]|nr:hypothetical protein SAMN05216525_10529 [Bradyrhizobium sp. Gha]
MPIALTKLQPRRRCRIPRRPHPNLDYFFGRLERAGGTRDGDVRPDNADLDHSFVSQHRH